LAAAAGEVSFLVQKSKIGFKIDAACKNIEGSKSSLIWLKK
jgi:hypothetical protein